MASSTKARSRNKPLSGAAKFFIAFAMVLLLVIGWQVVNAWRERQQAQDDSYNGFAFARAANDLWVTRIEVDGQPYNIPFYHHPRELEGILMDATAAAPVLADRPQRIIISVDPDEGSQVVIAAVEISRITGSRYDLLNIPTTSALSRPDNRSLDVPVATCADAVNGTTVIRLIHADKAGIVRDGACVMLLYRTPEESVMVADRFAYRLLRIMR